MSVLLLLQVNGLRVGDVNIASASKGAGIGAASVKPGVFATKAVKGGAVLAVVPLELALPVNTDNLLVSNIRTCIGSHVMVRAVFMWERGVRHLFGSCGNGAELSLTLIIHWCVMCGERKAAAVPTKVGGGARRPVVWQLCHQSWYYWPHAFGLSTVTCLGAQWRGGGGADAPKLTVLFTCRRVLHIGMQGRGPWWEGGGLATR